MKKMTTGPVISVIVPVHNTAPYLEKSVRSIMDQDMEDIEIILVENFSDDGSYEICKALAETDRRIKVIKAGKKGLSYARNVGLDASAADYVCFVDSDDTIDSEMLSSMYAALEKYGTDAAICNFVREFPDGRKEYPYKETGMTRFLSPPHALSELLHEEICSSACTILCRKSLFDNVRFPEGRYYEDHATTYLIADAAKNGCVHIGKSYYHYLQREGSTVHSDDFRKICDYVGASAGRILFIAEYPDFTPEVRRNLMLFNTDIYINNMIKAIRLAGSDGDLEELQALRHVIPAILSCKVLPRKKRSRLMRMRYLWKLFCFSRRRKAAGT